MKVCFFFPFFSSHFSNSSQIFISYQSFFFTVPMLPDFGIPPRRNGDFFDVVSLERFVTLSFVISTVGRTLIDVLFLGKLIKERVKHSGIIHTVVRDFTNKNVARLFVDSEMEFEPGTMFAPSVFSHFPFAFAEDFDPGGIHGDVEVFSCVLHSNSDIECLSSQGDGRVVG